MKPKFLRITFLLTAFEGLIAGSLLLATPSEPESARFLGYSALRLFLAGATFLISLAIIAFSISNKFSQFSSWLNDWVAMKDRLVHTLLLLALSILLLAGGIIIYLVVRTGSAAGNHFVVVAGSLPVIDSDENLVRCSWSAIMVA